ncbi:hypothetical protein GGTG_13235 [Gaeumannomyces tritici R3-111a-1]|uniref:Uncharacterized protein n=1 Tax=Gaeumannomyces tritici (strain R3-111a-1) TaxID=644352 RepID=J3PIA7_GAET3|nr:hypothetical protein GGTG_13235 [Gaeumannomyces tritici R3-111a-1]EJT69125.1 hypothetical protein GGTG_13235 [Gaeumannomyces tritici R3-111a-1]
MGFPGYLHLLVGQVDSCQPQGILSRHLQGPCARIQRCRIERYKDNLGDRIPTAGALARDCRPRAPSKKDALANEATLLGRYWQQRRERDDRFHALQEEALLLARLQSDREEDDVALPPNWQLTEELSPYTRGASRHETSARSGR